MNLSSIAGVGSIIAIIVLVLAVLFGSGLVTPGAAWVWILIGGLALARLLP
jgi:hypothetical protein